MSSSKSTEIPRKTLEKSSVTVHANIDIGAFLGLKFDIDNYFETMYGTLERKDRQEVLRILDFYGMMTLSLVADLDLRDKYYTPVYFSFEHENNTIGGCAIWIMTLKDQPNIKFAYFYGIHRFPDANKETFSSHLLLHKVITYCKEKQLEFICLPRPCMEITTRLWYSLGMTFDLDNNTGNYLAILKPTDYNDSYFKDFNEHNTELTATLPKLFETVQHINLILETSIFDTASLTTTAGILFKDNYDEAIKKCNARLHIFGITPLEGGAIKNKKQKTKTKDKKQKTKSKRQKTKKL